MLNLIIKEMKKIRLRKLNKKDKRIFQISNIKKFTEKIEEEK